MRISASFRWGGILVAALAACGGPPRQEKAATPVRVRPVELYSGAAARRYSAEIQPQSSVNLAFKVSGYLDEILQRQGVDGRARNVQGGDVVARGAVLARVRESDYAARASQAEAALAAAKAGRDKADQDFKRASALYETNSLTRADYDSARAALDAGEAQMREAAAGLEQARISREDCALKSPMDALVLDRKVERGDLVGPGVVGFVVADLSSVKVVFGVPDLAVGGLKPGDTLPVHTESLPGADLPGRITAVSPSAARESRVFDVEVTLPNPKGELKAGMIATVVVPGAEAGGAAGAAPVAVVPLSSIVRSPANADSFALFLVLKEGDRSVARVREVGIGEVYGNLISVTSGVKPGDSVIVTGAALVSDGEPVRIIP